MILHREGYPTLYRISDPYVSLSIHETLALYHDKEGNNFYVFTSNGDDVTNRYTVIRSKKGYAICKKLKHDTSKSS